MKNRLLILLKMGSYFVACGIMIQMLLYNLVVADNAAAQNVKNVHKVTLSVDFDNASTREVLRTIETKTDFKFIYDNKDIDQRLRISLQMENQSVAQILTEVSRQAKLKFKQVNNNISVQKYTSRKDRNRRIQVDILEQTISGTITDLENGEALPGVNIVAKGTAEGTVSDIDGNYRLTVGDDITTLVFSSVGYLTEEVEINGRSTIDMVLSPDIMSLSEVVVVGYGTRDRADLTGAVSTLRGEAIAELPINSVEQALSGQVSGVQLRQNGAPGGGPEILVRGIASTGGNNAPLYVVDGIPLTNVNSQRDNFILNAIDPSSIESISVLKDASSKAIYGSRAANGVIIITTKRGKVGKPSITFGVSAGQQTIPDFERPSLLNAEELRQYRIQFFEDRRFAVGQLGPREQAELDRLTAVGDQGEGTYWFDEITRNALMMNYNVNVSGGAESARYNVSANFMDQDGTLINTNFKRYGIRANMDVDVTDRIRFGVNLAPTHTVATGARTDAGRNDFSIFSAVPLSRWTDPSAPVRNEDGTLTNVGRGNITTSYNVNPLYLLIAREDRRRTNQLLTSLYLEVDIIEGLTARTFGSVQYIDRRNTTFEPSDFPGAGNITPNLQGTRQARAGISEFTNLNLVWENTLNYATTINDRHQINALAGFTMEKREGENTIISAVDIIDESIRIPNSGNVNPENINNFTGRGEYGANTLVSLIGRLDYSYMSRYYLTGTIRRDGSSRFGADNRYGNFPSLAVAWRISNEPFFSKEGLISDLKIEAGYGVSGSNANVRNYQAQGTINSGPNYIFGGEFAAGSAVTALPNTLLTWEEAQELNFGIDVGLLDDRLYFTADYYNIETSGFLANLPLPRTSGFSSIITNLGSIQNRGVEIELNFKNVLNSQNLVWNANFNFTRNRSKVLELAAESGFIRPGTIARAFTETAVGEELALYRGFNVTGLFTQEEIDNPDVPKYGGAVEGSLKYEDGNDDGVLGDAEDFVIIGNPNADFIYGMTHNLRYRNFDFNVVFVGSTGQQIINGFSQYNSNQDGNFNVDRRQLVRWRPGLDPASTTIPGTASPVSRQRYRQPNSLFIEDADYLWVRNITLGYNLSGKVANNFFKNARIYTSIQNPFLITNYENGNPEINRSGDSALVRNVNYGAYPISRIFTLGANITF
ncbi:SusC/RagA family TonB-linked outer membrane protein [Tunicatimonas pelagia]|uniref:SusC/RagA family TonB-linked outer membrane protein n=1 Tax=Tunicatimonas pelagia TaxID=931531 RepID=UPI0026669CBF|nr:SusC/RagA family TonB-linked outer membrane protein [Tunicatimonas pelagia]WKN45605.1 SusC/RagA family TonB-linked outer membrane protein [Tunicatimonas pelagia]